MDVEAAKHRLKTMLAIDIVCVAIAVGAAIGAFVMGIDWLLYVFVGALVAGLAAQIWFIVGLRSANKGV